MGQGRRSAGCIPSLRTPNPTALEGILWGTLPFGCSLLAILLAIFMRDRAGASRNLVEFPAMAQGPVSIPEAR